MPRIWGLEMRRARARAHRHLAEIMGAPLLRRCHRCGRAVEGDGDGRELGRMSDPGRVYCWRCLDEMAKDGRGCPNRFSPGAACRRGGEA